MAYVFRGTPPRILQRLLDNRSGLLPGRNRTGDRTRARWGVDAYDDRRTVIFDENQIVSFPQKLQSGSIHYDPLLDPTGQFSQVTASVVAGVSDSLILQSSKTNKLGAWVEDHVPEQGQISDYWLTGTSLAIGEGFTGQLRDKTVIRKFLNVSTQYPMLSQTASMVYYNRETETFDLAGAGTGNEVSNPKVVSGAGYLNVAGIRDARLFGPFGNNIISGSNALGDKFSVLSDIRIDKLSILQSTIGYSGTLLNANFAASEQQTFVLDDITEPFLLEKIQLKIPLAIGEDWFEDTTRTMFGDDTYGYDCGGPAITVALQRQDNQFRRELICSATIIPQGDEIYDRDYARLAYDNSGGTFSQSLPTDPEPGQPWTFPKGFLCFSTPGAVLQQDGNGQYTGSVTLDPTVAVSNGVVSIASRNLIAGNTSTAFDNSLVLGINPFGRAMDLRPSGRSYFGKEYTSFNISEKLNSPPYEQNLSPTTFIKIYNVEKSSHSPYVILPNDKFILSVSKYRSILNQYATSSFGDYTNGDRNNAILSGSHDVTLNTGSIEIIMYGSLISSQRQYHHGLNQQLTSFTMNEVIGESVLDQFDVESPITFSGSYVDDIITGTLGYDENGVLRNDRGVAGSIVGAHYLIASRSPGVQNLPPNITSSGSLLRGIVLRDETETYYDSFVPSIYETQIIDDGDVWSFSEALDLSLTQGVKSIGKLNIVHIGSNLPEANTSWQDITGSSWNESYPFESKYSQLLRYRYDSYSGRNTHAVGPRAGEYDDTGRFGYLQVAKRYTLSRMTHYDDPANDIIDTVAILANDISPFPTGVLQTNNDIVAKATYGFGNGKQQVFNYVDTDNDGIGDQTAVVKTNCPRWIRPDPLNQSPVVPVPPPVYPYLGWLAGGSQRPVIVNVYRDVEIEGWKYGLKSGYPTSSRMVLSRNHHGYMRDVLEQRPFTKYVVDGKVEASPVYVKFMLPDPHDTDSSNLHYEATSSLPYFDGTPRNRTTPTNKFNLVQIPIPGFNNVGQLTINDVLP